MASIATGSNGTRRILLLAPDGRRKNNSPAGIATTYQAPQRRTTRYASDWHLDAKLVWAEKG